MSHNKKIYFVLFLTALTLSFFVSASYAQKQVDLSKEEAKISVGGKEQGDYLGSLTSSGDINGDGILDLIVSAVMADPKGRINAGEVYIFFGKRGLKGKFDLAKQEPDVVIMGAEEDDNLGISVATPSKDVNGDRIDDLVVGAKLADAKGRKDAGSVYVIFGKRDWPKEIDLKRDKSDITIIGEGENFWSSIVGSGDLNNDGISEILIGAPSATSRGKPKAGKAYVILGKKIFPRKIDLAKDRVALIVYGSKEKDFTGWPISSGDINGDGIKDLIIGATFATEGRRENCGKAYVIYGSRKLPKRVNLSGNRADINIIGENENDSFGVVVATDFNGDGIEDLIMGAPSASVERMGPQGEVVSEGAGKAYIIFGKKRMPRIIDLKKTPADIVILGEKEGDSFGYSIACGNMNMDSFGDIVIGAPYAASLGKVYGGAYAGKTYVFHGGKYLPKVIDLEKINADITILGRDSFERSGVTAIITDIDGDGIGEVVIGAVGAGEADKKGAGKAYVISEE